MPTEAHPIAVPNAPAEFESNWSDDGPRPEGTVDTPAGEERPAADDRREAPAEPATPPPTLPDGVGSISDLFANRNAPKKKEGEAAKDEKKNGETPKPEDDKNKAKDKGKETPAPKKDEKPAQDAAAKKGAGSNFDPAKEDILARPRPKTSDDYSEQYRARGATIRFEREQRIAAQQEVERLKQAGATGETKVPEDYHELKQKAARLAEIEPKAKETEERLYRARMQERPEYKQYVVAPMDQIHQAVGQIAKNNDLPADQIYAALTAPDAERRAKLDALLTVIDSPLDRDALVGASKALPQIWANQEFFEKDAKQNLTAFEEKEKARVEQENRTRRQDIKGKGHAYRAEVYKQFPIMQKLEGDDDFAKAVNPVLEQARKDADHIHEQGLDSFDDAFRARLIEDAPQANVLRQLLVAVNNDRQRLVDELKQAKEELDEYKGPGPSSDGDGGFTPDPDDDGSATTLSGLFAARGMK